MFSAIGTMLKTIFTANHTIALARVTAIGGSAIMLASSLNWSPLLKLGISPDFTWQQAMGLGGYIVVQGIATELARRYNAPSIPGA